MKWESGYLSCQSFPAQEKKQWGQNGFTAFYDISGLRELLVAKLEQFSLNILLINLFSITILQLTIAPSAHIRVRS